MTWPTLVEELAALRADGYTADFSVTSEASLRCTSCGHSHPANRATIESIARFEGQSNPDDQSIVFGLRCEHCGLRGVLVTAYGPTASEQEAEVILALPMRPPT